MTATAEGRTIVRNCIHDHLEFSTTMSAKIMFGALLYNMGKSDSSFLYFERLMANPEEEDLALVHAHMGQALDVRGVINLKNEQIKERFFLPIPSVILPSAYLFRSKNRSSTYVKIYYLLKFSVKVEGLFNRFHVNVPITVGTESNSLIVCFSSNSEQTMFNDNDLPPSYDS